LNGSFCRVGFADPFFVYAHIRARPIVCDMNCHTK